MVAQWTAMGDNGGERKCGNNWFFFTHTHTHKVALIVHFCQQCQKPGAEAFSPPPLPHVAVPIGVIYFRRYHLRITITDIGNYC